MKLLDEARELIERVLLVLLLFHEQLFGFIVFVCKWIDQGIMALSILLLLLL